MTVFPAALRGGGAKIQDKEKEVEKLKNRLLKVLAAALVLVLVMPWFAACGNKDDANTLTIWSNSPFEPDYKTMLESDKQHGESKATEYIVNEFEKLTGKKVKLLSKGWSDVLNSNIIGAASSGLLPDLLCGETSVQAFADDDFGLLDELALSAGTMSNIYESSLYNARLGGKVYGIPMATGNFALVYNEAMLIEAGVTDESGAAKVPVTLEELKTASKAVREYYASKGSDAGGMLISITADYGGAFRNLYFQRAYGGDIAKGEKLTVNTTANANAFNYMRELGAYSPKNIDYDEQTKIFNSLQNNQAAFAIEYPVFLRTMPNANIKTARLPKLNESDAGTNVLCGNLMFSIPKKAKNKELAKQFLEFMLRDDVQLELYRRTWHLPVTKTAVAKVIENADNDELITKANAVMMPYIDSMKEDSYNGGLPGFLSDFLSDVWGYWATLLRNVVKTSTPLTGTNALLPTTESNMKKKIDKVF